MDTFSMLCNVAPAIAVVIGVVCLIAGSAVGAIVYRIITTKKLSNSKNNAVRIIEEAYAEAKTIKKEASLEAKEESQKYREQVDNEIKERRNEVLRAEERLNQREKFIETKELSLDKKTEQLEEDKKALEETEEFINSLFGGDE